MRSAIQAGDIVRSKWPSRMHEHLNLYLGSGRCGACFDAFGLMNNGFRGSKNEGQSNTRLMHADHWHRGAWGMDSWLPVARLVWAGEPPPPPTDYHQEMNLYDGRLTTRMTWPGVRVSLTSYFHPYRRDLLAVEVSYECAQTPCMPDLLLAPETDVHTQYDQHLTGTAEGLELEPANWWLGRVRVGNADSVVGLKAVSPEGAVRLSPSDEGISISFVGKKGRHLLLIGIANHHRRVELCEDMHSVRDPQVYAAEAQEAWHRRWGDGYIKVPAPEYQALWARSLFYVLASYAPDVRAPAPPMGWAGNCWPLGFPQDLSYIHPALLRLGHLDIARSWVEFYRDRLSNMQEFTKRVWGVDGAYWAWESPIGPDSKLLFDGSPNYFQYELHNAAYPVRMAWEASRHMRDPQWTRKFAWPVIRESARFFGSLLKPEMDGTWGIQVEPSTGQDEMGGINGKNYLCALYSARYTLQTALTAAAELGENEPAFDRWRAILKDGLAFGRLLDARTGLLATCEGTLGVDQLGKEKHPVQLNPLIFLPMGEPDAHVRRAYERRYDLCAGVKENVYYGWTLAAYWLAASHMGDAEGLLGELGRSLPGRYVDPDWIQIYETSGRPEHPFYVTSHGLYLQVLNDAFVSDYFGEPQIGAACPDEWQEASFGGLRTMDGSVFSGEKLKGEWQIRTDHPQP